MTLSADEVRRIAKLARLAPGEDQVQQLRTQLAAVLAHMDTLREVDVTGVEPMTHPNEMVNRLDADDPRDSTRLTTDQLMAMAPETEPPFVKVPKVIGEGSA